MHKLPPTLDLDALRSFVLGIECGSFAQAATQLCRSTSAVSAQLKKLEMQCNAPLVTKKGRHLVLTVQGETLMAYGRRLLSLNDDAYRALNGGLLEGELRIGLQEDFGESLMPGILGQFRRHHPGVRMMARVDRNPGLLQALDEQTIDMALLWQADLQPGDGKILGVARLEWIYHQDIDLETLLASGKPLPLVMFDNPCLMRAQATSCLNAMGIPWEVMFVSHSLSGVWAAVQAGLGITLRTRIGMPADLVTAGKRLPSPGAMGIMLKQLKAGQIANPSALALLEQLITEALLASDGLVLDARQTA